MAPYVPLLSGVQVEIFHFLGGEIIQNRLWFTYDNPPFTSVEIQGVTDGVATWWTTYILPYLSVDLNTLTVAARDWTGASPGPYVITNVAALGGQTVEAHSANVAVVVPFLWPLGLRYKRNKHYVPGVPIDQVDLNTVSAPFSELLFEGYAHLVDAARLFSPALNWRWVVTSAWDAGVLRSDQLWHTCQGVPQNTIWKLGQRRKRLPA